ncbi:MAG: NTP transferase domain-containing protein [Muribaculaceae bacterium]|nr:NTP transferase domain-containing protein [Muribaculaceae bacterium]MDE6866010.1 NTP transferase domain-containing protein [Muribaculaceae bacterium]
MNYGIIAAGEGSRLVEEGVAYPKPLVPLAGTPMIGRLIDIFLRNNAEKIAVIVNEQMKEVQQYLIELAKSLPVELDLIIKSTPSSMHSFYEVAHALEGHGRFITTTVDTIFYESEFEKYVKAFESADEKVDGMMALTKYIDDEKPLYVEVGEDMRIEAFLDRPGEHNEYVSGGIYGLDSSAVEVLDRCMSEGISRMRNYQRHLLSAGLRIEGFDMGKIIDVDHAGDIRKAEEFIN